MKNFALVWVVVIGIATAWLIPQPGDGWMGQADGASLAPGSAGQDETAYWLGGEIALDRQTDGHFYADVAVDGSETRFLVDTGASFVALTGEDAEAIGLEWNESDIREIGRGASGPVYGVLVTLRTMELGDVSAHDVQAAIVPEGLGISLLGQSFLSQVGQVEIRGETMVLSGS